jgi:hypothetical protein
VADTAPPEETKAMQDNQRYYPVLSVGLSDFEDDQFDEAEWGDEAAQAYKERLEFARNMSPFQWRRLAEIMGEILFDGDRWDEALNCAIDGLMSDEGATEAQP